MRTAAWLTFTALVREAGTLRVLQACGSTVHHGEVWVQGQPDGNEDAGKHATPAYKRGVEGSQPSCLLPGVNLFIYYFPATSSV